MTTTLRIQPVAEGISKELLAQRTHIFVDWQKSTPTAVVGDMSFDNVWFLRNDATGAYIARDADSAPNLNLQIADAATHTLKLSKPTSVITLEHVSAYIRSLHALKAEALLEAQAALPAYPVAPIDGQSAHK